MINIQSLVDMIQNPILLLSLSVLVPTSLLLTKSSTPPQLLLRFAIKLVVLNCGTHHLLLIRAMQMEDIVQVNRVYYFALF